MNRTAAITDTARDEWSVLAALRRPDLYKPSLVDIAEVIQVVENQGKGHAATLAWLLSRSHETLAIARELRRHAEDAGTLRQRGNGVLLGALCDRDLASLIDAPDSAWNQIEEIVPDGIAPEQLESMLATRRRREEDKDVRAKMRRMLEKIRAFRPGEAAA